MLKAQGSKPTNWTPIFNAIGIGLILATIVFIGKVVYDANQPLPEDGLKQTIRQLSPQQALDRLVSDEAVILDVRNLREWEEDGHVDGAISLPLPELDDRIFSIIPDKDTEIIVMCYTRNTRSMKAVEWLRANGYTNVHNLDGGLKAWESEGFPLVPFVVLDDEI